jgi:hypothetical protein
LLLSSKVDSPSSTSYTKASRPDVQRMTSRQSSLWDSLDAFDDQGGWNETAEEIEGYAREVEEEIKQKFERVQSQDGRGQACMSVEEPLRSDEPELSTDVIMSAIAVPSNDLIKGRMTILTIPASFPHLSFHTSHIIDTSTPRPLRSATFPTVTTPDIDTPQPALRPLRQATTPSVKPSRRMSISTPVNIPSPSNTPSASNSTGEGNGKCPNKATPIPIGSGGLGILKGKKDYQNLTKHFEMFEKDVAKLEAVPVAGKGKGRAPVRLPTALGLGGKVLANLRFCIPPQLNQIPKHKKWWRIVGPGDVARLY